MFVLSVVKMLLSDMKPEMSINFLVLVNQEELNQFKYRQPLSDIKIAKTIPGEGIKVISYSVHF